jgi:hypothetical protein
MLRIEISGGTLASPVLITDPRRLEEFTFWDGPGNNDVTLENAESGPIIDWKTGFVAQPPATQSGVGRALRVIGSGPPTRGLTLWVR